MSKKDSRVSLLEFCTFRVERDQAFCSFHFTLEVLLAALTSLLCMLYTHTATRASYTSSSTYRLIYTDVQVLYTGKSGFLTSQENLAHAQVVDTKSHGWGMGTRLIRGPPLTSANASQVKGNEQ